MYFSHQKVSTAFDVHTMLNANTAVVNQGCQDQCLAFNKQYIFKGAASASAHQQDLPPLDQE
jgi:hypothetical protein